VVFSFFVNMLDLVQGAVNEKKLTKSVIFDGTMSSKAREAAKEKFQTDPGIRLFLSSDAGGVGVDLPQANYLISLDLPWSAGKMDQRNARIIRLSSEWEKVTLLNLLIRGSIEDRQYDMLESKRAIASAVVDGTGIDEKGQLKLSLSTLSEFIENSSV
jgi:SNF2 family DNA or RNA helicase